jgi:uncharacterized protein YjbI with pentapeptide repeats
MNPFRDTEARGLILEGKVSEFNARAAESPPDLENVYLRGADLQNFDLSHANLRGAYLRGADLRGADLFWADLDGASLHGARVSGARFPRSLGADEIRLSIELGTRLRTHGAKAG